MGPERDPRAAFEQLRVALARAPRDPASWRALAELYLSLDQPEQAREACARALTLDPQHAHAWLLAAAAAGDAREAESAARRALALDPTLRAAQRVLGDALFEQGRAAEAVTALRAAPEDPQGLFNLALALDESGALREARETFERARARAPQMVECASQLAHLKRRLCDWNGLDALNAQLRDAVARGAPGVAPFAFLAESGDPAEQRRCAETHARTLPVGATSVATPHSPLRVAFVSSGFNNHPTGLLVVDLIERLRGSRIATHAFATTPGDGGALRARLARAFGAFHEVHGLPHHALAQAIRAQAIDVLLDLRGWGGGTVAPALAERPAPRQLNWLAYPGSSGAPWIDALIADSYVVPRAAEPHYSERVLRLPHCFQPSDATRVIAPPPPREACGLPARGRVFASFNNSYKIAPDVFAAWLRILDAVPDSVLWLLAPNDDGIAAANLRAAADARGVDPRRLVFMDKLPHDQYLARYAHVDLFLDTWPYGAHTTASDALFAGCPVLTREGASFAARVAGSLLTTLELPELIARDTDDYVARAVALCGDRAVREKLAVQRAASTIFDMARFAADFEALLLDLQ